MGAAPTALQVDSVDVDVGVGPVERAVPLSLDQGERLLVEVGDGRGGEARPPEDLGDVLYPPGGYARQAHLHHGLLDAGLPPAVALDDRRLSSYNVTMGSGMPDLQYASCLDNSNHTEAGCAPLYLDAIPLPKCARNCTLPAHRSVKSQST